jgi:hypothetical protein
MITDDEMTEMPWTRDRMTLAEFEQWVATREEAGRDIDIETCEVRSWYAIDMDPYGIKKARGEEPYEQIGTNRFVRSPESRGWVWEADLPREKAHALYDRIHREDDAYDVIQTQFVEAAATFRLSDAWDVWHVIQRAVREFAGGRGVLDVRTVAIFALYAMEAGIKSRRTRREPKHCIAR